MGKVGLSERIHASAMNFIFTPIKFKKDAPNHRDKKQNNLALHFYNA